MKNPTLETIKRFASVLGVETWQLFTPKNVILDKKDTKGMIILCPHCHQPIELEAKVVEKGGIGESA